MAAELQAADLCGGICGVLRDARRVALLAHVTPDADCIASLGGLGLGLRQVGKEVLTGLPPASVARKLDRLVRFAGIEAASRDALRSCDLAVVLDTAKEARINFDGALAEFGDVPILNIDHHASNTRFGRWNWISPEHSSTAEMIFDLLVELGVRLTPEIATLLYAGIHSDTQGFSLTNATPSSLRAAAALAGAGARIREVCEWLHRSRTAGDLTLLAAVYRNARVSPAGRVAWSTLTRAEMAAAGCDPNDIDDQVEVPRSIAGISVALLFTEGDDGKIRINFRGEQGVHVLGLAQEFGGGGHATSAGARISGPMESVVVRVVAAAERVASGAD